MIRCYLADSIKVQELLFLIALVCLSSRELRCGHCKIKRGGRAGIGGIGAGEEEEEEDGM